MKKLIILISMIALLASVPALACEGPSCDQNSVDGLYQINANSYDYSNTSHGNDGGQALASGNAGGTLETQASAGYTQEPVYEDVLVSKTYEKYHEGTDGYFKNVGNHHGDYDKDWRGNYYYVGHNKGHYDWVDGTPGWTEYKDFPPQSNTQGWTFVRNNYETQLVGYEWVPNPAIETGKMTGHSYSNAWSYSKDYGLTSKAGAGASFKGDAFSKGTAEGDGCGPEIVKSDLYVEGEVKQMNYAGETGYSAGGISGGNESGGSFKAVDSDFKIGNGYVSDENYVSGSAVTKGFTNVSIDPYGNNRSISGITGNFVSITSPDTISQANVYGNGGLNGVISNGSSFAGGNVSFNYAGSTFGAGGAMLNASVVTSGNSTTATVSGSSVAFSN
jgi:hypothetical protein